jgi:transcriptional regulator with XRE-family HTH domain
MRQDTSDGAHQMEAGPAARLADYVRDWAPAAGYSLGEWGEQTRLARAAQIDTGTLTRLLNGERLPKPAALWPLAVALNRPYPELLVEAGTIPAESLAHMPQRPVASQSITAETLADQWGVTSPKSRELVADMLERIRLLAQADTGDKQQGSA